MESSNQLPPISSISSTSSTESTATSSSSSSNITVQIQQIVERLNQLFRVANHFGYALPISVQIASPDESLVTLLRSCLENPEYRDICDRLNQIAKEELQSLPQQCQQLHDMQLYLSLLSYKTKSGELRPLAPLVAKVKEASGVLAQTLIPSAKSKWKAVEREMRLALGERSLEGNQSVLSRQTGLSIDDKTFSHIHAEALIGGTSLEGNADEKVLTFLDTTLKANEEKWSTRPWYQQVSRMVRDCLTLAEGPQGLDQEMRNYDYSYDPRKKKLQDQLNQLVSALQPGQKTMVPAGWLEHSMKMGIERQADGKLTITLYNTGAGLPDYHAHIRHNGLDYYQPFVEVHDVDESKLYSNTFAGAYLQVMCVKYHPSNNQDLNISAADIYGLVIEGLGGRLITCRGDREKFMPPQNTGTCTWSSLLAVLFTELQIEDYYAFVGDILLDTMCAYYQSSKDELASDPMKRLLLNQSVTRCAQFAIEASQRGQYSAEQLAAFYDTITELTRALDIAEQQALERQAPADVKVEYRRAHFVQQLNGECRDLTVPITSSTGAASSSSSTAAMPQECDISAIFADPYQFADRLQDLEQLFLQSTNQTQHQTNLHHLEEFFCAMATDERQQLWDLIPQEKIPATLSTLAKLSNHLLLGCHPLNRRTYSAYAFYLSAQMTRLAEKIPEIIPEGTTLPYQRYLQMVSATFERGFPTSDHNLYSVETRYLRQCALNIFVSKPTQSNFFSLPKIAMLEEEVNHPPLHGKPTWDVDYIAQVLAKDDELLVRLKSKFPEDQLSNTIRQIAYALCDLDGECLPEAFCALRRQAFVMDCFCEGTFPEGMEKPTFSVEAKRSEVAIKINRSLKRQPARTRDFQKDTLPKEIENIRTKQVELKVAFDKLAHQYDSEADVLFRVQPPARRALELLLAQDTFNGDVIHRNQQVFRLLAYYLENIELLFDHDTRMLLRLMLFEDDFLETAIRLNPENNVQLLSQLVQKGLQASKEKRDISAIAFFCEIGRGLDRIARTEGVAGKFPDTQIELRSYLLSEQVTHEEKTLILQQLVAAYATHPPEAFTADDAITLMTALLYERAYPLRKFKATDQSQMDMKQVFQRYLQSIQTLMSGPEGTNICRQVSQHLTSLPIPTEWTGQFPVFTSLDGVFVLDVLDLQLYIDSSPVSGLPESILSDTNFRQLFSQPNYSCHKMADCYEFLDERGIRTQIKPSPYKGKQLVVRQYLDGQWFQMIKRDQFAENGFSKLPKEFLHVCDRSTLWISLTEDRRDQVHVRDKDYHITHSVEIRPQEPIQLSPEQTQLFYAFITGTDEAQQSLRKEVLSVFAKESLVDLLVALCPDRQEARNIYQMVEKHRQHELTRKARQRLYGLSEPDKPGKKEEGEFLRSFVSDPSNEPLAGILSHVLQPRSHFPVIRRIQRHLPDQPSLDLVDLKTAHPSSFANLCQEALLWANGTTQTLRLLEFPSLHLSFTMCEVNGEQRACCVEHPGYVLANNQRYYGLAPIRGAIVLENDKGKRKLVLPLGKLCAEEEKPKRDEETFVSLSGPPKSDKNDLITRFTIVPQSASEEGSIVFELDKNLHPIATTAEQKLYLATILFAQRRYEEAQQLVRASYSKVIPYSPRSVQFLLSLLNAPNVVQDKSPHATALAYSILAVLPPDKVLPELNPETRLQFVSRLSGLINSYRSYQQQMGAIRHLLLPQEEMIQAAHHILNLISRLDENPITRLSAALLFEIVQKGSVDSSHIELPKQESSSMTPEELKNALQSALKSASYVREKWIMMRPGADVAYRFSQYYADALRSHAFDSLRIMLVGARNDSTVPRSLVMLLHGAVRAMMEGRAADYPDTVDSLKNLLQDKNKEEECLAFMQRVLDDNKPYFEAPTSLPLPPTQQSFVPSPEMRMGVRANEEVIPTIGNIPLPPPLLHREQMQAFHNIPNGGIQFSSEEIAELQHAILGEQTPTEDAKELASHVNTYWSHERLQTSWHRLDPKKIKKVERHLQLSAAEVGKRANALEQDLLLFANALPADIRASLVAGLGTVGKELAKVTINDLTLFAARARHFTPRSKNPVLAEQEQLLLAKCMRYLDMKAQQQQHVRVLDKLEELKDIPETDPTYNRVSEECYQQIMRGRSYDPSRSPELLVFEVVANIGLYDWQVRDLERMLNPKVGENPNVILEKVMGSGKTKVYLRLIALSQADGDHLPFIVVHSSQFQDIAPEMEAQSLETFGQAAYTLQFTRDSDSSEKALRAILEKCDQVRKQRNYLVVTDKTLHNLSLTFDLLWDSYLRTNPPDEGLERRIEVLRDILNLFKTKGKATLDEADSRLSCRFETVYAIGEAQPIDPVRTAVVADLFRCLSPLLQSLIPYSSDIYAKNKGQLIAKYISEVVVKEMPHRDHEQLKKYFEGDRTAEAYVDSLSPNERQALAIARYQFQDLLPLVLKRRCGEHYGYSAQPDKILPVPYIASGVPNETSEFAFPYVLLDYAVLTLEREGPSPSLLRNIFQELRVRSRKERAANPRLLPHQTKAYREFITIIGEDSKLSLEHVTDEQIQEVALRLKQHHPNRYEFAKKYLFPDVKIHPRKLTSTPFILTNLFLQVSGFTGTPWNHLTYPMFLQLLRDELSAGKTIGIIWKNTERVFSIHRAGIERTEEGLETLDNLSTKLIEQMNLSEYHAFIDVGATFNGIPNDTVAKAMLRHLPEEQIKAIVYYEGDRALVLERGKAKPIPFSQCGLPKEERFVYYDQAHTTGTDIPIGGRSLLSVDKNTKMRDLEQGYMRDRQAETGKRVDIVTTDEDLPSFWQRLGISEGSPVGIREVTRCVQANQEEELAEQLLMGAFASLRSVMENHLRTLFLSDNSPKEWHAHALQILPLIGETVQDDPYQQFGRSPEKVDREIFVNEQINNMMALARPLIELSGGSLTEESLRQEFKACFRFYLLTEKIEVPVQRGVDQLNEKEVQKAQQRLAQVQKNTQTDLSTQKLRGPIHWNWDPNVSTSDDAFYRYMSPAELFHSKLPEIGLYSAENTSHPVLIPVSTGQTPMLSLSEVFASDPQLASFAGIFDLDASYNFLPLVGQYYTDKALTSVQVRPFSRVQPNGCHLLIRKEKASGRIQATLISDADEAYLNHKLAEERKLDQERAYETTLYHTVSGTIQWNGAKPIDAAEIRNVVVQAKFFNGESLYSEEEISLLRDWILEKGPVRMRTLFVEHILANKEAAKVREFEDSALEDLFHELIPKSASSASYSSSSSSATSSSQPGHAR